MQTRHPLPGVRSISPAQIATTKASTALRDGLGEPGRDRLILAQKDAAQALGLRGSPRHVLEKLCSCYGGKLVKDEVIVWPTNSWLTASTGLDDRTIRRAVQRLIGLGLIIPKDSPRRYRYVRRGAAGEIQDAFGFILSPLIHRHAEFAGMVLQADMTRRTRAASDDEISRHRIAIRGGLTASIPYDRAGRITPLLDALGAVERRIPRRNRTGLREPVLAELVALREEAEALFYELTQTPNNQSDDKKMSGSGGHNARHLEKNPENSNEISKAAKQSRAGGEGGGPIKHPQSGIVKEEQPLSLALVVEACPAVTDTNMKIRSTDELIAAADFLRPSFGASPDAWAEGARSVGLVQTALLAIYVHQLASDDARANGPPARGSRRGNFGGLFRWLIRKSAADEFVVASALMEMRRKRLS